jgi:predicted nucleotidyltransferase
VLFASATLGELLRLFMLDPEREFYQRELQRLTGAHLRQLQRDLARLELSGLVASRADGNRTYYRAVPAHPAFADLRAAVLKTIGLGDRLREALGGLGDIIKLAFVFGSVARGEDVAGSDVDLLLVGSVTRRAVAVALAPVAAELERELNPVLLSAEEFAAKRREGDHFITSVLADRRIWVVGDEAELPAAS